MTEQEIDFVTVIADDDFRAGGKPVMKNAPFRALKNTAKQLVASGQAHYATEEELKALADEQDDDAAKTASKGKSKPQASASTKTANGADGASGDA